MTQADTSQESTTSVVNSGKFNRTGIPTNPCYYNPCNLPTVRLETFVMEEIQLYGEVNNKISRHGDIN